MARGGIAIVACGLLAVTASSRARADQAGLQLIDQGLRLDAQWPALPPDQGLTLDQQLVDRMTELGNRAVGHIDTISHDTVGLRIDGRHQRAHLRLTAGNERFLTLNMEEDIHIGDGEARVASHVDLGIRGRNLHIDMPDVEMLPDEYQGSHYVEVRVPLFERRW